jgi:hypothetical protein
MPRSVCRKDNSNKTIFLSRYILDYSGVGEIDHIDGNPLNNQKENLRICTHQENTFNTKSRDGTSMFKGVYKQNHKWRAQITFNHKHIHLGYHKTEHLAAVHYDVAALYLFGEFAYLNFPERHDEYARIIKWYDSEGELEEL